MTLARSLLVSLLVAGTLASGAGRADAAPAGHWTVVPADAASNQNFILQSVAAPAAGDVWAVGYHWEVVGGALEFRALAQHFDGTRFATVPTPDRESAPATDRLADVSGASSADVWAVGTSRAPGAPSQTLVEHWNGSTWTIVTSANPGAHGNDLEGVTAIGPADVWAVGARQDGFYQAPLAEHWNGTTWTAVAVPQPAACTGHSYLTDVSAVSTNLIWASGWCGSGGSGGDHGYVVRWNGTRWSISAGIGVVAARNQLYGITAVNTSNVWAVGYTEASASDDGGALALHWNGSAWSQRAVDAPQDSAQLLAVAGRRGDPTWAVGSGVSPQPPFAGPASVRFTNGGDGKPATVPVSFGTLRGVAYDPGGKLWAVGQQLPGQNDIPLIVSRPA